MKETKIKPMVRGIFLVIMLSAGICIAEERKTIKETGSRVQYTLEIEFIDQRYKRHEANELLKEMLNQLKRHYENSPGIEPAAIEVPLVDILGYVRVVRIFLTIGDGISEEEIVTSLSKFPFSNRVLLKKTVTNTDTYVIHP